MAINMDNKWYPRTLNNTEKVESLRSNLTFDIETMGDYSYGLSRAQSMTLLHSHRPRILVTRAKSVPDLVNYVRKSNKYKPQWGYTFWPDYDFYDDFWYDRYSGFRPLYKSSYYPHRYYHPDIMPNPHYWSGPYTTWNKYKGFWYSYNSPFYYRRYFTYYDDYPRYIYTPFRTSNYVPGSTAFYGRYY
ncbi:Internalin [Dirofilaria immitis]